MVELEIRHDTRYDYSAPVTLAHHLAHLQPLADPHQQLLHFALAVSPAPGSPVASVDAFGNPQHHFTLVAPHRELQVVATSRVRVAPRFAALAPAGSPTCAEVAARLRYVAGGGFEPAVAFAQPSPYVPRLAGLRELGAASLRPARPLAEAALDLMARVHAEFAYQSQSTAVDTPLEQVLRQKRGVCQDFAHLLAGVLRIWGLPARYVSGYLLTQPPEGGAPMQGADASHAWVQLWCPDTPGVPGGWLDLDPTNNLVPGTGHVRVAVGRDFGDVTPLRGVIRGGGHHTLAVGVSTRRTDDPAADAAAEPHDAPESDPGTGLASVTEEERR